MKETIEFWLIVIYVPVIIVGVIEVYNDTNPPGWFWRKTGDEWGKTKFVNPDWEKHVEFRIPFLKTKIPIPFLKHVSRYHMVMFFRIIPVWLAIRIIVMSKLMHYQLIPEGSHWYAWQSLLSILLLFAACQAGVMGLEDFAYFTIQSTFDWLEPHALRRVLHGDFGYFKDWIPLPSGLKFPGHWVALPVLCATLLYVRQRFLV